jgi:type IV pilus assembly protein PilW
MKQPTFLRVLRARGFSLVELLVAMALGLIVIGAMIAVFVGNKQSYRVNQGLSDIQENARLAFEMMARDIREAGVVPCKSQIGVPSDVLVFNAMNNPTTWWEDWLNNSVVGYDGTVAFPGAAIGTGALQRATGTSAIMVMGGGGQGAGVMSHDATAQTITLTDAGDGFAAGDIAMICDYNKASIFQVKARSTATVSGSVRAVLDHSTGTVTPGNCSGRLEILGTPACAATTGIATVFNPGGVVVRVNSVGWFVGCNGRAACTLDNGRSLYRIRMLNSAGTVAPQIEEILDGVRDMQLTYLVNGGAGYLTAAGVGTANAALSVADNWDTVLAVAVNLQLTSIDASLTAAQAATLNASRLVRNVNFVVNLRNRS